MELTKTTTKADQGNPFVQPVRQKKITVKELAQSVADLEGQVESLGKNAELSAETVEYVKLLRSE